MLVYALYFGSKNKDDLRCFYFAQVSEGLALALMAYSLFMPRAVLLLAGLPVGSWFVQACKRTRMSGSAFFRSRRSHDTCRRRPELP